MNNDLSANRNNLYPVFLKLEQLHLLLVGGGNVALEKLHSLLANSPGARITVVGSFISNGVRTLLETYPLCQHFQRDFQVSDLDGKDLVILATDNKVLHQQIKLVAVSRHILVNVADTPALCDFYLGSVVQKGNLKVAISTNGKSPTIAKRVKEMLNESIPDDIDDLLQNMQDIRSKMTSDFSTKVKLLNEFTKQFSLKNEA